MIRGFFWCTLAAVTFGASTPLVAALTGSVHPVTLAGLLYAGAAIATVPLAVRTPVIAEQAKKSARGLALAVVFGGAVGPLLLVLGLGYTSAASASLLLNFELVATTVLAAVFYGEYLGGRVLAGTALVTGASVVLAWSGSPDVRLGGLLVIAACLCWGIDNCTTATIDGLTASQITACKGVLAGGVTTAVGVGLSGLPPLPETLWALLFGGVAYGLSSMWWVIGARETGAARAQVIFATAPFVGAIIAWIWFGESIQPSHVIAIGLAVGGVALVQGSEHDHEHDHLEMWHSHPHTHDDDHHEHDHDELAAQGVSVGAGVRHEHLHYHPPTTHTHPHVPDLHHRHH